MDFNMSDRQKEWLNRVQSFMHKHVRPAVPIYKQQDEDRRALEGDPDPRRSEEEGAAPKASGTCSCRRRRMRTMNSAARD